MIIFIKINLNNMMKKFKYTKLIKHKGINFQNIQYGTLGLQSTRYGIVSKKHIIFIKQFIQKKFKKFKEFKFNITLNQVSTKKPIDTRMGGGKGLISDVKYFLKPGSIVLEIYNIPLNLILPILKIFNNKISIKLKLITIN